MMHKKRVVLWYQKAKDEVDKSDYPQVKIFVRRNELNIEYTRTDTIK